jgi:hypothetical protein
MEPIDETLLPLTSLISDLLGTNKHHIFDGNFSKISVVRNKAEQETIKMVIDAATVQSITTRETTIR